MTRLHAIFKQFKNILKLTELISTFQKQEIATVTLEKIINFAKLKLKSTNFNVQRHAIHIIGAFANKSEAEEELLDLISNYMDSPDARTRAQATNSLLCLGKRGIELPPFLYLRAEQALKDDYECGRKEALQLVFELSQVRYQTPMMFIKNRNI